MEDWKKKDQKRQQSENADRKMQDHSSWVIVVWSSASEEQIWQCTIQLLKSICSRVVTKSLDASFWALHSGAKLLILFKSVTYILIYLIIFNYLTTVSQMITQIFPL